MRRVEIHSRHVINWNCAQFWAGKMMFFSYRMQNESAINSRIALKPNYWKASPLKGMFLYFIYFRTKNGWWRVSPKRVWMIWGDRINKKVRHVWHRSKVTLQFINLSWLIVKECQNNKKGLVRYFGSLVLFTELGFFSGMSKSNPL